MSLDQIAVAKFNREARGDEKQAVKGGAVVMSTRSPLLRRPGAARRLRRPVGRRRAGQEPDRDRGGEVRPRHQPEPLSAHPPNGHRLHLPEAAGDLSGDQPKRRVSDWDSPWWRRVRVCGMRSGVSISVSAADRRRLEAIVADRNTPQKHVVARADHPSHRRRGRHERRHGRDGQVEDDVWRWQERFAEAGVDGLLADKTRPPGKAPVARRSGRRGRAADP